MTYEHALRKPLALAAAFFAALALSIAGFAASPAPALAAAGETAGFAAANLQATATGDFEYAIDLDGDGVIKNVNPGATVPDLKGSDRKSVSIRATAAVWCRGPKGVLIKSWTDGQTKDVN